MKNMIKPISAAAVAVLMSFSVLPVYADETDTDSVTKDETVYTVLNADGSVKEITVSDTLHSDNGFNNYEDTSSLTDVENLKSEDAVEKAGEGYLWNSDASDIYYQGKSTKDLPLHVSITYTLDGKQYTPQELLGKSGHIKIKVEVENTSKQTYTVDDRSYELVTPFITAIGGMLDEDVFENVEINHGTVTSDSSHSIVAGVMIPGLRDGLSEIVDGEIMSKLEDYLIDDITIEADVTEFESPTLMIAAATSTDALEDQFEDTDLTTIFDQLDQLEDATNQLIEGTSELYDGAIELNDGIGTLQSGTSQLASGASTLYDGSTQLATGANSLYAGLSTLSSKSAELNSGVQQVADAIMATVNEQLTESGLSTVTWSDYADKFNSDEYLGTSPVYSQTLEKIRSAAGNVDDSTLNALIYIAAQNQDSSTSFEDKLTSAGTVLTNANTIATSTEFKNAQAYAAHIAAGDFSDAEVASVLQGIRTQNANNPSDSVLDTVYSTILSTIKSTVKASAQMDIDDATAAKILGYACNNWNTDLNTSVAVALSNNNFASYSSDARNDTAVITILKAQAAAQIGDTDLATIYNSVAEKIGQGDNTALVFAYACAKHQGVYDPATTQITNYFSEYAGDLTTLVTAQTSITNANTTEGQQFVKAAVIATISSQASSKLQSALTSLNGVNALVQGVKTYTAGVDSATAGAKSLADGANQVASGSKDLKDGIDTVNSGVGTLKSGSQQLADGAKTLKDGMEEYNDEAISKLTENSKISDLESLADLFDVIKDEGSTYNNYSGISEGSEGSVKFVYKVNAVKQEKVETTSEEEAEEKTSFWDRIVGLFDFSSDDSAE